MQNGHSKRRPEMGFQDLISLKRRPNVLQKAPRGHSAIPLTFIKSTICRLRSLFGLFLSGRLRQVLLYSVHIYEFASLGSAITCESNAIKEPGSEKHNRASNCVFVTVNSPIFLEMR